MSKVKTKTFTVCDALQNIRPDANVLDDKIRNIVNALKVLKQTFDILLRCEIVSNSNDVADIELFINLLAKEIDKIPQQFQVRSTVLNISDDTIPDMLRIWEAGKDSTTVAYIQETLLLLHPHVEMIRAKNNGGTLAKIYGPWYPLNFAPHLDVREILLSGDSQSNLMFSVLIKFLDQGKIIHDAMTSTNYNHHKLTETIESQLHLLSNIPELNRCDDAIKYLVNCSKDLNNNFNTYHLDAETSGNPVTFLHSYITDVIQHTDKKNVRVILQMKRVIAFLAKRIGDTGNKTHLSMLKSVNKIIGNDILNEDKKHKNSHNDSSLSESDREEIDKIDLDSREIFKDVEDIDIDLLDLVDFTERVDEREFTRADHNPV